MLFPEFTIHLIYTCANTCTHRHRHPLFRSCRLVVHFIHTGGGTGQKSCIARQAVICWWNSRTRRERSGRVERSAKGTGAEQGIINARVSLTSMGQKSLNGLATERPPGTHRHDDRCVKTISCSPGTLSRLLLSNDSLARSFGDQKKRGLLARVNFLEQFLAIFRNRIPCIYIEVLMFQLYAGMFPSRRGGEEGLNIIINMNYETCILRAKKRLSI